MIVVSYYTQDPFYTEAGRALIINCTGLGLACDIQAINQVGRKAATNHKPLYILQLLKKYKQDLWWFDVDSKLLSRPPAIPEGCWMAVHYQPAKIHFPVRSNAIGFRYDDRALAFLRLWLKRCPGLTDHTPMIQAFRKTGAKGVATMDFNSWHQGNGFKALPHPIHG